MKTYENDPRVSHYDAEGNLMDDHDRHDENSLDERDSGVMTGMFRDPESTQKAYNSLNERGYSKDDINLIMSDETRKTHYSDIDTKNTEIGTKAAESAGKGSAIGGAVGATVGIIAAIGTSLVIPGIGLVIAGPIAAGLAGAGAGGITGGIIGALVGSGIPEARAKLYESGIKEGNVVISVRPKSPEDAEYFEKTWQDYDGEEIHR